MRPSTARSMYMVGFALALACVLGYSMDRLVPHAMSIGAGPGSPAKPPAIGTETEPNDTAAMAAHYPPSTPTR
jgi:hypothetical protein